MFSAQITSRGWIGRVWSVYWTALCCLLLWMGGAERVYAQSIDASGTLGGAFSADPVVGVMNSWMVEQRASVFLGTQFEFADGSLLQYELNEDGSVSTVPIVDDLAGLSFSGMMTVTPRLSAAFSVPVWFHSRGSSKIDGLAFGDLELLLPVRLCERGGPLGCMASVYASLPTGNGANFLGSGVVDGGVLLGTSYLPGPLSVTLALGIGGQARRSLVGLVAADGQQIGGVYLRSDVSVGAMIGENLGLHLETRWHQSLLRTMLIDESASANLLSPAELLFTVRGLFGDRYSWSSGVGRGLNGGIGAARWRAVAGMGVRFGSGALLRVPRTWTFMVENPGGQPVQGALVKTGERELGITDGDGLLELKTYLDWDEGVVVLTKDYLSSVVTEPDSGANDIQVRLVWKPYSIAFSVRDSFGQPIDADVKVTDLEGEWGKVIPEGDNVFALAPGRWRVDVSAKDFGSQSREINVVPGQTSPEMEIVLFEAKGDTTLVQRILDPDGNPLEGVRVLLDGQPVGTTGNGGVFEIAALAPGKHTLTISADQYRELRQTELFLEEGKNEFEVSMQRLPGTVRVSARSSVGVVDDAVVRFTGPARLPPTPLGETGQRQFGPLRPGTWNMLVVSPAYGIQERTVIIPENSYELLEVEVVLQPEESGGADVELRVIDSMGQPVSGAAVSLDGQEFGLLATGGFMSFQGLKTGIRLLEVTADKRVQQGNTEFLLSEGTQEILVTLAWEPGATQITVRTREGAVNDATVRFLGPLPRAPLDLGVDGRELLTMQPGEWTLIASSLKHGLQQRTVRVAKDSALLHEVDIVLLREDGGVAALDLQVVDPRGEPVNGAEVFLDGFSQGKTTELGLQVGERSAGERRLEIRAPAFRNYAEMVELSEDSGTHKVHLKWGPGAVRVKVTAADVPVRDAVIRGIGPAVVQPVPVNVEGERILSLAPGQWQLIVASGDYGFSQASLTIPESSEGLVEVPIELEAIDEGFGQVLFRIRGANDEPISGAKIKLDGELKGESEDGALLCDMLFPGQSSLTVEADNFLPLSIGALTIKPGSQQFIVALEPLTYEVFVRVTNGAGEPVEAAVSFTGPADIPSVQTGPSGEFRGWLPSGDWQVIASGDGLGPLRETLRIGSVQKKYEVDMLLRASRIEARGQTVIPEKIGFAYDSDRLTAESAPILDEVANFVTARPGIVSIEVQGHTDASGLIAYNQDLSRRRALAVLEALIIRGVAPERLLARGYGTQRPLVPGRTQDAYATNRRVEFVILEEYDYSRPW